MFFIRPAPRMPADLADLVRRPPQPWPEPTAPKFKVGDAVTAPNGQPRVVTGMRWDHQYLADEAPIPDPMYWGWVLDTVHPDDPSYEGGGFEEGYTPRGG